MVYGAEVVLPPEVTMGSLCVKIYGKAAQDQLRREISTWSISEDGNLLLKMHDIGRRFSATMNGSCAAGSSKWTI
jgi:hypothetical protein